MRSRASAPRSSTATGSRTLWGRHLAAARHRRRVDPARSLGRSPRRAVREAAREAEASRMMEPAVHVDGPAQDLRRRPSAKRGSRRRRRASSGAGRARCVRSTASRSRSRPGEVVGFLGPNGAGKTTTLKMLSGLLYVTCGEARVLGHVPSKRERDFLRRITLVMGNRNQLQWDLPALDSFELNRVDLPDPARPVPRDPRRADRAARGRRPRAQAGTAALARRADEGRDRRLAPPPAAGALPRRADDRPRRHDAEAASASSSPSTGSATRRP